MRAPRRGFTLLEILVTVALLATSVVAFLGLSQSEVQWTRDVEDRGKALALARNMLVLMERGWASALEGRSAGPDGAVVVDDALEAVPAAKLALGSCAAGTYEGALDRWATAVRARSPEGFQVSLRWAPADAASGATPLGTMTCTVAWVSVRGRQQRVDLERVIPR